MGGFGVDLGGLGGAWKRGVGMFNGVELPQGLEFKNLYIFLYMSTGGDFFE